MTRAQVEAGIASATAALAVLPKTAQFKTARDSLQTTLNIATYLRDQVFCTTKCQ